MVVQSFQYRTCPAGPPNPFLSPASLKYSTSVRGKGPKTRFMRLRGSMIDIQEINK
jgi:hypothetical protein